MSSPLDSLPIYEKMALLSEQMLNAARSADWELLSALELRSSHYLDLLKQNGIDNEPLSATHQADNDGDVLRERKVALIKKILADDRDIRDLTEPWMKQLSKLIKNTSNESKLVRAYGVSRET